MNKPHNLPVETRHKRVLTWRATWQVMCLVAMTLYLTPPVLNAQTPAPSPAIPYGQAEDIYLTNSGMAIHNNVLYMTWPASPGPVQRFLVAIDISKPATPTLLGKIALNGFPQDVALLDNHALVVNGQDLYTIDITTPAQMKITHTLRIAENPMQGPQAIVLRQQNKQHIAYLACRRGGVAAINLTKPDNPALIGKLPLPGFLRNLAIFKNQIIVAADTFGMHVINLPKTPENFAQATLEKQNQDLPFQGTFSSVTVDEKEIFFAAGRVALASYLPSANSSESELSWPRYNPPERGDKALYYGTYAHHLAIVNSKHNAKQAKPMTPVSPSRIALIADGEAGLSVVDITGEEQSDFIPQPLTAGGASNQALLAINIIIHNNHAFVIDQNHGLRVFDLTTPAHPKLIGQGVQLPVENTNN